MNFQNQIGIVYIIYNIIKCTVNIILKKYQYKMKKNNIYWKKKQPNNDQTQQVLKSLHEPINSNKVIQTYEEMGIWGVNTHWRI